MYYLNLDNYTYFIRLFDIFFIGPFLIHCQKYIKNKHFNYILIILGILTIIYNLVNILYINFKLIDIPNCLKYIIDIKLGKTQLLRLINIIIMYPLLAYIYKTNNFPTTTSIIFIIINSIGVLYNLFYYIHYIYKHNDHI
jgi:hypothetical protein